LDAYRARRARIRFHYMPWLPEPLETKRLLLRAPTDDDLEVTVRMLTDPAVRGYLGGPVPEDRARAALSGPLGDRWGSFLVTLAETEEVVGSCMLERIDGDLEISYQLLPEHCGHGYAREATLRVLEWAWESTDATQVIAITQTANAASMRLLEVIGMQIDSHFEEHGAHHTRFRMNRP
jgi:RimJ/RimL family protein N-acetyltransferase